ncbi:MAG TPA: hypothetical protein PLD27_03935 [bacterium]|nr:hypothetical protein [bacterium]HOL47478.1 hypothetical protein [bacterium]HPQ18613.1 hypothetical protein [bacterium]
MNKKYFFIIFFLSFLYLIKIYALDLTEINSLIDKNKKLQSKYQEDNEEITQSSIWINYFKLYLIGYYLSANQDYLSNAKIVSENIGETLQIDKSKSNAISDTISVLTYFEDENNMQKEIEEIKNKINDEENKLNEKKAKKEKEENLQKEIENYIDNINLGYIKKDLIKKSGKIWEEEKYLYKPLEKERELEVKEGGKLFDKDLPFNTHLTISGLKTVRITGTFKKYRNVKANDVRRDESDIKIEQTLKVRVEGKIGESVNVNIDYDDAQDDKNKQKLSIVYDGKERALSKSENGEDENIIKFDAAFGDIELSLPQTEFLAYNKQLFGVRGGMKISKINLSGIKLDDFKFQFIASRTKGEAGHIEFTGKKSTRVNQISDINYIKRTYYQITELQGADTPTIVSFSEKIYRDDRNIANNENAIDLVCTNVVNGETYAGKFDLLQPGDDYSIDYQKGIVRFKRTILDNDVIVVNYETTQGYKAVNKLIRLKYDYDYDTAYFKYELKNRYYLGATNILVDDPNFIVEIQDMNNNRQTSITPFGSTDKYSLLHIFGLDEKGPGPDGVYGTGDDVPDGRIDPEYIDNDLGIIIFPETMPFNNPAYTNLFSKVRVPVDKDTAEIPIKNQTVYTRTQTSRYNIYVEYQSEVQQYFLNAFNIVKNSEVVKVDGKILTRNVDYYIDYQTGFLIFLNSSMITPYSKIVIDYEKIPVGIGAEKTLLGTRLETNINKNFFIGTSFLMNKNDKAQEMPDLSNTPLSLTINDINTRLNLLPFTSDLINFFSFNKFKPEIPKKWIEINVTAEVARSVFNPNTYGKALIDNMESIKDSLTLPINKFSYLPSYIPEESNDNRGVITFEEQDNIGHEENPENDEEQKSLKINYYFDNDDTWLAFRYPLSRSGVNLSKKTRMELWLKDFPADKLSIDIELGIITEDCDGDGLLDQEDGLYVNGINNHLPNGFLDKSPNEDEGININGTIYGNDNNILESEDMDGDGQLDAKSFKKDERKYIYQNIELNADTSIGSNGWIFYNFNLFDLAKSAFKNQDADSTNIKHIRVIFRKKDNVINEKISGSIYTDYIAIVGNKWEVSNPDDTSFYVRSVNNKDNPYEYIVLNEEIGTRDIEDDDYIKEQAIEIVYDNLIDTKWTYYDMTRTINISDYNSLIFYIRNTSENYNGETLAFRFGDANNYFQYSVKLPPPANSWTKVTISLKKIKNKYQELLVNDTPPYKVGFDENYYIYGQPNIKSINKLSFGIIPDTSTLIAGKVQINFLHTADVIQRTGIGKKIAFNSNIYQDFITANGSYYQRDNKFQKIGEITSTTAQSYVPEINTTKDFSSTLNLHKLTPAKWQLSIPLTFKTTNSKTQIEPDEVENVERNKLGYTESKSNAYTLAIRRNLFPTLNISYNENFNNTYYKATISELTTKNFLSRVDYSYSISQKPFKKIPVLKYISLGQKFSIGLAYEYQNNLDEKNYITGNYQSTYDKYNIYDKKVSITHQPWKWITLTPTIKYYDKYHKTRKYSGLEDKNLNTDIGIDIIEFIGIKPNLKFSYTRNLNYDIANIDSEPIKNISGNAGITINMAPEKWWKYINFFNININTNANYSENLKARQYPKKKDANVSGSFALSVPTYFNKIWKGFNFLELNYSFKKDISAKYTDLDPSISFSDIISNYFEDNFISLSKKKAPIGGDTISLQRTNASNTVNHNISGRLIIWKPLNLRYNFSLSDNTIQSQNSETFNKNLSANLNGALNLKEINLLVKTQSATLTNDYLYSVTTQPNSRTTNFKPKIGGQINWSDFFKTGFDLPYSISKTENTSNNIVSTLTTTQLNPSFRWSYLLNKPFDIENPLQSNLLRFKNRLELNGTISANLNKRTGIESQKANTTEYDFTTGLTWDAHQNLRMSGSLNFKLFTDKVRDGMDYFSYGFSVYGELKF